MSTLLRRRLAGLAALLALAGIVVGLPAVLLAIGADPIPNRLPTWDTLRTALTSPDDGTLALTAIAVIAWASWLILTGSILLELAARLRGIHPPRLPALHLPQATARGLVSTAALLFIAAPLAVPAASAAPAQAAPAAASTPVAGQHTTGHQPSAAPPTAAAPARQQSAATVEHVVRRGESLWSVAEQHLGSGVRYREILHLNPRLPAGGSFITPGQVLHLPAPEPAGPHPSATYIVQRGDTLSQIAEDLLGDPARYPEIVQASRHIVQPGGVHLRDPDVIDVGWTLHIPQTGPPAPAAPAVPPPAPATPPAPAAAHPPPAAPAPPGTVAEPQPAPRHAPPLQTAAPAAPAAAAAPLSATAQDPVDEDTQWPVRTSYGVGALLAAGVIALISTRRRTQQRRRRPGRRIPMPDGPTAQAEQQLRAAADPMSATSVDTALRMLARSCATAGTPLPAVRAARLTATQFDLYLADPATLPEPWTGTADATVWTLEPALADALADVDTAGVPAPYPALVTIGHDEENGHVFLDLEHLGALAVAGDPDRTREVLAALAIELATSTWADDLQVTIVGAYPELEDALHTGRIRYLPSTGRILDDLAARAEHDRAAMHAEHTPDLQHARVTGAAPDAWPPQIVLIAGPLTPRQRNTLQGLVDELPRVALAAVTTADASVGEWTLDLAAGDGDDQAVLSPIGLQIRPQRIPADAYADILHIAALTHTDDDTTAATHAEPDPTPEPTLAQLSAITPLDRADLADTPTAAPAPPLTPPPAAGPARPAAEAPPQPHPHSATPADAPPPVSKDGAPAPTAPPTPAPQISPPPTETVPAEPAPDEMPQPLPSSPEPDPVPASEETTAADADVQHLPQPAPRILLLGPVRTTGATGPVEPNRQTRLLEYAAYLALHPGASHTAIDDAIWPNRRQENNFATRHPATVRLRTWLGQSADGEDYLPRHQTAGGYALHPAVRTDVDVWDCLLAGQPLHAPTEHLEQALDLVRGRPFEGHHPRYYAWAERTAQRLISEIVDASYELARRRLMEGRWRAAEQAAVIGLSIDPAQERLWRMRILAAHEARDPAAEQEALDRMLTVTAELECDLEPDTEKLLASLRDPAAGFDQLLTDAL